MRPHRKPILLTTLVFLPTLSTAWSLSLPNIIARNLPFTLTSASSYLSDNGAQQPLGGDSTLDSAGGIPPTRIAVIGAGAGGSASAFWIEKARERHGANVVVDVYEQEGYIGGRSTVVYPYGNTSLHWVELGASIFVDANRNMMRAAKEFNLNLTAFVDRDDSMGIWDGSKFVLETGGGGWSSWLDNLRVIWRYGYTSCTRGPKLTTALVTKFLDFYTWDNYKWFSIKSLGEKLDWIKLTSQTVAEYLTTNGVGELFIHELVEAASRVNYGQNSDEIHALMGVAGTAADNASGVVGGNFQIFENFLMRSGARVHLNTQVTGLRKITSTSKTSKSGTQGNTNTKWIVATADSPTEIPPYDHVIIAAPYASSKISILGSPAATTLLQPPVEYVHLHVTLLSTTVPHASPAYFGLKEGTTLPSMILTTWDAVRHVKESEGPEFNSLSYHHEIETEEHGKEYIVKIFSKERVEDEWLERVFGWGQDGKVGWVVRKEWDAYPRGKPTTEFPPISPDDGLWYVNSFEPFISTMETETLSARNVVDLLFDKQFGAGICPPDAELKDEIEIDIESDVRIFEESELKAPVVKKVKEDKDVEGEGKKKGGWGGTGAEGRIYGWDC